MPNIIRTPQNFTSNQMYSRVKESYEMIGEEMIVLAMFHVNRDEDIQPRCVCYNNVYGQSQSSTCPYCYGTTFAGGIKEVWRVWGVLTDDDENESKDKQGVWNKEDHSVQLEPWPELIENDYILRVKQWDNSKQAPLIIGSFYLVNNVQDVTVRTGNRYAGVKEDRIAQTINISLLPKNHPIYEFQVSTFDVNFPRYDSEQR